MQFFGALPTTSDVWHVATFLWPGLVSRWCWYNAYEDEPNAFGLLLGILGLWQDKLSNSHQWSLLRDELQSQRLVFLRKLKEKYEEPNASGRTSRNNPANIKYSLKDVCYNSYYFVSLKIEIKSNAIIHSILGGNFVVG